MAEEDELTPMEARLAERVAAELRRPEALRRQFDADVMSVVRESGHPSESRLGWWVRRRSLRVSPLMGLVAAAAVALVVVLPWMQSPGSRGVGASPASAQPVQFVLYAPQAATVALVGDFNDWDRGATPLARAAAGGFWTVTVPLRTGRYQYAFVVDGVTWMLDPDAPRTLTDDLGEPNSIVTVTGRS